MKNKIFTLLPLILCSLAISAMDFEKDNPEDKVVRLRCAWKLREFSHDFLTIGHTPLRLFDSCMAIAQSQERTCQEDNDIKESYECRPLVLQATRNRCKEFYKKALEVVLNCDPSCQEKDIARAKEVKSRCTASCTDMQKACYLSDTFELSDRYAYGPYNRARLCGLFNYLRCRSECADNYSHEINSIAREWEDEKKTIEEAEFWNRQAKIKYNNAKV